MDTKGVCYDVGRVYGGVFRTRPVFDAEATRRELEIIRDDLHCNAVRLQGRDVGRLTTAAQDALALGLEVWLSPELFEKPPPARSATSPRRRRPPRRSAGASVTGWSSASALSRRCS